jgi:hypothetical protein
MSSLSQNNSLNKSPILYHFSTSVAETSGEGKEAETGKETPLIEGVGSSEGTLRSVQKTAHRGSAN